MPQFELLKLRVHFPSLAEDDPFDHFYVQSPKPGLSDRKQLVPACDLGAEGWQLVQFLQPDPLRDPNSIYAFFQREVPHE